MEFVSEPITPLAALIEQQGVRPIKRIEELHGDFWPDDETADELVETIRQWRREGGHA